MSTSTCHCPGACRSLGYCPFIGAVSVPDWTPAAVVTAEPITEVVELEAGGEFTLQRFADGTHRVTLDTEGVHLSFPVTARDVQRVREATGALVLAEHLGVLR